MDDLLKVLDKSEEEQFQWLLDNNITDGSLAISQVIHKIVKHWIKIELADLAFRLRDEAVINQGEIIWHKAEVAVCEYMGKPTFWFTHCGQPIHWIIAALIAKEKENG